MVQESTAIFTSKKGQNKHTTVNTIMSGKKRIDMVDSDNAAHITTVQYSLTLPFLKTMGSLFLSWRTVSDVIRIASACF